MGWSKAAEAGANTIGKLSDGVTERKRIADAPGEGQRRLNELDAVQPGFWGFARAGWRPFLLWGCSVGIVYTALFGPLFEQWFGLPHAHIDTDRLETILWFMMGGVGVREIGKHAPGLFRRRGRK